MDTIEDIIKENIDLNQPDHNGWCKVYCEVCGDGKRTKGKRGGWNFNDEMCFYNCFNCGIDGNFDPNRENPYSKNMWEIFRGFDIPKNEVANIITSKLSSEKIETRRKERITLPKIDKPDYFQLLTEFPEDDIIADEARYFLWEHYKIKETDYPFYLSTGKTVSDEPKDHIMANYLRNRIIIPAFDQNDNLMYWQGRLFIGENGQKFISCSVDDSDAVMFNMKNIYAASDPENTPLYITESFTDSYHVNGVAIITNNMKASKIKLLNRNNRPKVVIPDYNKDGMNLANQAIEEEWGICLPDILPATDICSAINAFGKLYVLQTVANNTFYGFQAEMKLKEFKIKNKSILV